MAIEILEIHQKVEGALVKFLTKSDYVTIATNQTITGTKTFSSSITTTPENAINIDRSNITKGTTSSMVGGAHINFRDSKASNIGQIESWYNNGQTTIALYAYDGVNSTAKASLMLLYAVDGTTFATAPTPYDKADNSTKIATTAWVRTATGNTTLNAASADAAFGYGSLTDLRNALGIGDLETEIATIDLSKYVSLADDQTITGLKTFDNIIKVKNTIYVNSSSLVKGVFPESNSWINLCFNETSGWAVANRLAMVGNLLSSDGKVQTNLYAYANTSGSTTHTYIGSVYETSTGLTYGIAPTPSNAADNSTKIATTAWIRTATGNTTLNAASADKATADAAGNVITNKYVTIDTAQEITGIKVFPHPILQKVNVTKGTNPTTQKWYGIEWIDSTGSTSSYAGNVCLQRIEGGVASNGDTMMYFRTYLYTSGSTTSTSLSIYYPKSDSPYATAPTPSNPADNSIKIATTAWIRSATGNTTLNAATSDLATKALQDGNGNVITSKYVTLDTDQTISSGKTFSKNPIIKNNQPTFVLVSSNLANKGTAPSGNVWSGIYVTDNTGTNTSYVPGIRYGALEFNVTTANESISYLRAYNMVAGSSTQTSIELHYPLNGNPYATAPTPADPADNSNKIVTTEWIRTATGNTTLTAANAIADAAGNVITDKYVTLDTAQTISKYKIFKECIYCQLDAISSVKQILDTRFTTSSGTTYNTPIIRVVQPNEGNYGACICFGSGGNTVVGGGESAAACLSELTENGSEKLYLTADNQVIMYTSAQTYANKGIRTYWNDGQSISRYGWVKGTHATGYYYTAIEEQGITGNSTASRFMFHGLRRGANGLNCYEFSMYDDTANSTTNAVTLGIWRDTANSTGYCTTITPALDDNSTKIPTTAWIRTATGNTTLNAATATLATKANQDGSGNIITNKYVTLDTEQNISGGKTFTSNMNLQSISIDRLTVPSSVKWFPTFAITDKSNYRLCSFTGVQRATGNMEAGFYVYNTGVSTNTNVGLNIVYEYESGNKYATAPTPADKTDSSNKIATTEWVRTATGNTTLNAATANVATKADILTTSRTIFGNSFNGSANISGGLSNAANIEFTGVSTSSNHGGYIDFHFNGSSSDYTSRIIESSSGTLNIPNNLSVSGTLLANLTTNCTAITQTESNSSTKIATTAFVHNVIKYGTTAYTSGTTALATGCVYLQYE